MPRHHRTNDRRNDYLTRFDAELRYRLKVRREQNIDDIAQAENLRLLVRFDVIASRYDDPVAYARLRTPQARAEHYRADNCQRGAGVRFRRDDFGAVAGGREIVSGDATFAESGASVFDNVRDWSADVEAQVIDNDTTQRMLEAATLEAGERGATIFRMTVIEGHSDIEAAAEAGVTRETANRKKQRTIRTVKGRLDADDVE